MTHYLEYRLGPTDDGKEVLFLMQKVLGFTTKKVRSVKHEEWGILLNGKRVTVRAKRRTALKSDVGRFAGKAEQNCIYKDESPYFV